MDKFKYSDSNKRYHTLDYYYKNNELVLMKANRILALKD